MKEPDLLCRQLAAPTVFLLAAMCACGALADDATKKMLERNPLYSDVLGNLRAASVPVHELSGQGRVAVTLAAGRVVAMAFSSEDQDIFWSHPDLGDTQLVRSSPEKLFGGYGGDRLWFSPELVYNWDGPPDWESFANYHPPIAMDPGTYRFVDGNGNKVKLHAQGKLPVHGSDQLVGFEVERSVRLVAPPLSVKHALMRDVKYVGIETSHVLKFTEETSTGVLDLWHLLQVPVGSILVVPFKKTAGADERKPLSYALPGMWEEKADHLVWRYGGHARAKFGLPAAVLTGRSAVFRRLNEHHWSMIVRQFPIKGGAVYADHPFGNARMDQAFHAWDGFGFGEMEFHSSALDAKRGPRELKESDQIWAFGGTPQAIAALASELLDLNVTYILQGEVWDRAGENESPRVKR